MSIESQRYDDDKIKKNTAQQGAESWKELKSEMTKQEVAETYTKLKEKFPGLEAYEKESENNPQKREQIINNLNQFIEIQNTEDQKKKEFFDDNGNLNEENIFNYRKLWVSGYINSNFNQRDQYPDFVKLLKWIKQLQQPVWNKSNYPLNNARREEFNNFISYTRFEKARAELNNKKINDKINELAIKITWKDKKEITEDDLAPIKAKRNAVGTLTFQAFIDDYLSKEFIVTEKATFDEIYDQREQFCIDKFSNKDSNRFKNALISTTQNNQEYKLNAFKKIKENLSNKELIKEANDIANKTSKEANGFLNRQELIISGLKGKRSKNSETYRIIQIIGRYYYNRKGITIDGERGPQTQGTIEKLLEEFGETKKFIDNWIIDKLKNILETNKKFNTDQIKARLTQNQEVSAFDTQKTAAYYRFNPEEKNYIKNSNQNHYEKGNRENKDSKRTNQQEQNNDKKIMDSTAGTTEKTDFIKELNNIPQEDILKNIPKETYKEYLKAFIKSPEVQALKFEKDKLISLLSKLFIKDKSDPDLIKLQKIREESPIREEMIINGKQQFQQIIKEQAELTALKSWKVLFEKLGISAINWKVIQKAEGKSYYQYSDANNPKISYQFTPITGEFSISTNNINDETRSIDITGTKQKKLFKIPGFTELMNQADPKTILPDKRLDSYKEIKKVIETKLGENIQHNLWDTETTNIKHEIEKEQLETGIITKIKSGLGLKKEQLNKNTDPGYYSFFAPILRTFKQPNISTNQLKILKQFADRIGERGQFTNWKTPTETNEVVQYTDFKKHIETPRNLIKHALSWEKIRDIETLQNNREKSKFTIGKIMNRLEKSWGKGGLDDRILDIEKVSTLINLRESPDITRNKEYQNSYNKLLSDIESEYLRQVEPTVRKQEVAYADKVILPKIQNTPA